MSSEISYFSSWNVFILFTGNYHSQNVVLVQVYCSCRRQNAANAFLRKFVEFTEFYIILRFPTHFRLSERAFRIEKRTKIRKFSAPTAANCFIITSVEFLGFYPANGISPRPHLRQFGKANEFVKEVLNKYNHLFEISPIVRQQFIHKIKTKIRKMGHVEFQVPCYLNGIKATKAYNEDEKHEEN